MNPVVPREAELLELAVIAEPQAVADQLPDRLALIVLHHGEQPAPDGGPQEQEGGRQQGFLGHRPVRASGGGAGQDSARLIDRLAEVLGDVQLKHRGDHGCRHRNGHPRLVAERHRGDPEQNAGIHLRDLDAVIRIDFAVDGAG